MGVRRNLGVFSRCIYACGTITHMDTNPPDHGDVTRFITLTNVTTECWLWQGAKTPLDYGRFSWHGAGEYAHRVSYLLAYGPIPPGLEVDHYCHQRSCVRPSHLRAV